MMMATLRRVSGCGPGTARWLHLTGVYAGTRRDPRHPEQKIAAGSLCRDCLDGCIQHTGRYISRAPLQPSPRAAQTPLHSGDRLLRLAISALEPRDLHLFKASSGRSQETHVADRSRPSSPNRATAVAARSYAACTDASLERPRPPRHDPPTVPSKHLSVSSEPGAGQTGCRPQRGHLR